MPSSYLASGDYATYGIPGATPQLVVQASVIVDSAIGRPEGLLWSADAAGNPAWMTGLDPSLAIPATQALGPGTSLAVTLPKYLCTPELVGEVLVFDRAQSGLAESGIVTAVSGTTATIDRLVNAHSIGATIELGLVITEQRQLPARRNIMPLMRGPVVRLMSALGRYSYGRRSDQMFGAQTDYALLSMAQQMGAVPTWNTIDINQAGVNALSGEVFLPMGMLLAPYSEGKIRYIAGYPATQAPAAIKSATAAIVQQIQAMPNLTGNTQMLRAGDTEVRRFADTLLDSDIKATLDPFRFRSFI